MRYLSLFSGIEAASVAWRSLGWEAVAFAEIEPFCCALLEHHYPDVPNLGDVTKTNWSDYANGSSADLIVGGSPCQAFSVAGQRGSLTDDRGKLIFRFIRICDDINPDWIVWENVPGVLNTRDNAFGHFLGAIVGADSPLISPYSGGVWPSAGLVSGPRRQAAWIIKDAQFYGVPQRRRRVFVVASNFGAWPCAEALFPVESCMSGHSAPGSQTGQETTGAITDSVGAGGAVTASLTTNPNADNHGQDSKLVVTHPLTARYDSGEDGCGRGTPLVAAALTSHSPRFDAAVRRLTPLECERLQGFPDGYTHISYGRPRCPDQLCPDGPRYRALGNSMAVPVMRWIGERISQIEEQI
ncbi:DNA cytosine methyltransferase [Dethiosulfatarculus sandiegensis]|uniref:DNA (cytosine-5-)-methyltransferase n=1 Tax=Dethiosulfatarculus sandiegensis TaxID=1429043 RepID=A0A0D2J6K6_9BACT|nr:DNA-cytosine methyltransferase [Dethiosulfatarculus sandiegensis]